MLNLQKWFNNSNKKQLALIRIAIVITSTIFISVGFKNSYMVFLIGIILSTVWLYLEFGKK